LTNGDCAKFDANGNIVDNGSACGGGGGGGIFSSYQVDSNPAITTNTNYFKLASGTGLSSTWTGSGTSGSPYIATLNVSQAAPSMLGLLELNTNLCGTATAPNTCELINAQSGAGYTVQSSDQGKLITLSNASAQSIFMPTSPVAGFWVDLQNTGTGSWTLHVPNGVNLDGSLNGTLALTQNQGVRVSSDGTNFFTQRGVGGGGGGGSGTVSSGTSPRLAYYASTGTTVSDTGASLSWSSPALTVGVNAGSTGQLVLANGGASGNSVTIQNNAATAAYNFNLPLTAGSSGNCLQSGGGGSSPMTWGSCGGGGNAVVTNPSSTQTITPTSASASGLVVNSAASPSVDLFDVNLNGINKLSVNSVGNMILQSSSATALVVNGGTQLNAGGNAGEGLNFGGTNSHITQNAASNDISGTISISAATSGSHTFATSYNNPPICVVSPTSNTGTTTWWPTTSTSVVTVNLSTSGTFTFNYICMGAPN